MSFSFYIQILKNTHITQHDAVMDNITHPNGQREMSESDVVLSAMFLWGAATVWKLCKSS